MLNTLVKFILIFLIVFTPIFFGSVELWAFSLMELGILLMIILGTIQRLRYPSSVTMNKYGPNDPNNSNPLGISILLFSLFLLLVLFQMLSLPSGVVRIISPRTYELRHSLLISDSPFRLSALGSSLSFFPFATRIEFFKWLTLIALFLFLLRGKLLDHRYPTISQFTVVIMLIGIAESLYGLFEFFSGHRHILYLEGRHLISSVTGTFINGNFFAGYLLMVIPLSVGYLFSREATLTGRFMGWRQRLSSLDGKTFLIAFGIIVMIFSLLFSASRMGILSLLLSFILISFFFREPQRGQRFSKTSILIFTLALLWAIWIGLDTVMGRFLTASEDFKMRWMIWVDTFKISKDFPFLGSGLGTFPQVFPIYQSFPERALVDHAENDFLQLTSEIGLIGFGLLSILFLIFFYKAIHGIRSLPGRESQRYIGIGAMVGILALMLHSLVEANIQIPSNAFLYTFLFAMVLRIGER